MPVAYIIPVIIMQQDNSNICQSIVNGIEGFSAVTENEIKGTGIRTEMTGWGGLVEKAKLPRTDLFWCTREDIAEFQDR